MLLLRSYVTVVSVLFMLSAISFVHADEGKNGPNQQGEVDFFISESDMSIVPSYVVHLDDSVGIRAEVSRMGDEFAVNWTKEGIALPLGGGGGDSSHMISPRVLYENGTYKMWYSGATSTEYRIFYATSPDGLTWAKHGAVLDVGPPGSLEDTKVAFHFVMKDGYTYKMWYSGADDPIAAGGHYRIFYATSPDGVNWTKQGLVLDLLSPGSTESTLVRSPTLIKDSGLYKMWYSGTDDAGIRRIHYATSPNGINWTRLGVVLDLGSGGDLDNNSADFPFVTETPCGYLMYYTGYQGSTMRILHATSQDGLSWEKRGLILDVGPDPDESLRVKDAFILFNGSRPQRMWYAGLGSNNRIFSASPNITEAPLSASVGFYLDAVSPASLIEERTDVGFPICGCRNISSNWTADSPGIHKILTVVDPQNLIEEANESNNIVSRDILVLMKTPHADAGPDLSISEGETVNLTGSGSRRSQVYWSDTLDDYSKISGKVNTTSLDGSVVLMNLSLFVTHTFDTDPGFILEDDQLNTDIWWDPIDEVVKWHTDREDPPDHYEKLVGLLPFPITERMDFSARVKYLYWRADTHAIGVPLFLQKNGSHRLSSEIGPTNNTLVAYVHGGDPATGDEDEVVVTIFDNLSMRHMFTRAPYDQHYWELLTTTITWDSDQKTITAEISDPLDNIIANGSTIVDDRFTFSKYGVGSVSTGLPAVADGQTDDMSISAHGYHANGWVVSEPITLPNVSQSFGILDASAIEPERTEIEIQILDESGSPIVSGIRPDDCPLSLDGLVDPSTNPRVMLKGILTTHRNETPSLLDWSISYYVEDPILDYRWDINHLVDSDNDGNYTNDVDHTGETALHAYGDNGLYEVHLFIIDTSNRTATDSCNITVLNADPTISTMPTASPSEGVPVTFNASAYDPGSDDVAFVWDWGDGSNESRDYYNDGVSPDLPNSPEVNPITIADQWTHAYGHAGIYLVNLTVVDDDGGSSSLKLQLNVSNVGPTSIIDISEPNPVMEGSPILLGGYFDDPSWLDNHTVLWDFGDGTLATGSFTPGVGSTHHIIDNVTHFYGDNAVFQVILNVTDDYGESDVSTVMVSVLNQPPTANISCPTKVSIGRDTRCSSSATDPGSDDLIFTWNWGDGTVTENTFYNNGIDPDPYPSPGPTYPFSIDDVVTHRYYSVDTFTVTLIVADDDGGNVLIQFDIEVVGLPVTTIVVGDPKYPSAEFYITSATPITFSVWDRSGEGIESTFYRIDSGIWTRYTSSFNVLSEGPHTIYFNSTDVLGGVEETKNLSLTVDDTSPVSELTIGAPNYTSVNLWISPSTPLTISSADDSCGLSYVEYQLDGGIWEAYAAPFTVQIEGSHVLLYRGIDNLGNEETALSLDFIVDGTPPSSDITVGFPNYQTAHLWILPSTTLEFASLDVGCGLSYIEYQIDEGAWETYDIAVTVQEEGSHTLSYRGVDNLGNVESPGAITFIVDGTPPSSGIAIGAPNYTSVDLWISPSTSLTILSADDGCGLSEIEYQLDGGIWQTYAAAFAVQIEGSHVLQYRGIDHLGSVETASSLNFTVDGTPPWSTVQIGSPKKDVTPVEVFAETPFAITSTDNGSGVDVIQYRIDDGDWSIYTGSFNLTSFEPGPHTIEYRGTDNLLNVEQERSLAVILIERTALEENQKPLIAIAFAIILGLIGTIVALKRPLVSKGATKRKGITFLAVAMPFVIAEIATGILSLFLSSIQIPPWTGLGMILDLAILIMGFMVELAVFVKNKSEMQETEDSAQSPEKMT